MDAGITMRLLILLFLGIIHYCKGTEETHIFYDEARKEWRPCSDLCKGPNAYPSFCQQKCPNYFQETTSMRTPEASNESTSWLPLVVSISVGGAVVLVLSFLGLLCFCKSKKRKSSSLLPVSAPTVASNTGEVVAQEVWPAENRKERMDELVLNSTGGPLSTFRQEPTDQRRTMPQQNGNLVPNRSTLHGRLDTFARAARTSEGSCEETLCVSRTSPDLEHSTCVKQFQQKGTIYRPPSVSSPHLPAGDAEGRKPVYGSQRTGDILQQETLSGDPKDYSGDTAMTSPSETCSLLGSSECPNELGDCRQGLFTDTSFTIGSFDSDVEGDAADDLMKSTDAKQSLYTTKGKDYVQNAQYLKGISKG